MSAMPNPRTALLVVDIQNDFISGTLALSTCPAGEKGEECVPIINELVDLNFDCIVYSRDWHPANHISFFENVSMRKDHLLNCKDIGSLNVLDTVRFDQNGAPYEQILWPAHCIQNTHGSEFHKDLKITPGSIMVTKGMDPEKDAYSAFDGLTVDKNLHLDVVLKQLKIERVFMCGIATDICVRYSAKDAIKDFETFVIFDACRGVSRDTIDNMRTELQGLGARFTTSDKVPQFLN